MPTGANNGTVLIFPEKGITEQERHVLKQARHKYDIVLCHEEDRETVSVIGADIRTYDGGNLSPCRDDLHELSHVLDPVQHPSVHVASAKEAIAPYIVTALRLRGYQDVVRVGENGSSRQTIPPLPDRNKIRSLLLKANGGIGNIVLTTFMLSASLEQGWETYFCPLSDIDGGSLGDLFAGAGPEKLHIIEPDDLSSITADITLNIEDHAHRSEEDFSHAPFRVGIPGHEPGFAARFFENATGVRPDPSKTFIGGDKLNVDPKLRGRIIVCPGSKTGWDSKRWPHMDALLRQLGAPIVLCRQGDLDAYTSLDFLSPITASNAKYITNMSLAEAASLLKSAQAVVANDCGPAHMAAAAGVPTLVLFGPSSKEKNEHIRPNTRYMSLELNCQPCQGASTGPGTLGPGQYACRQNYRCMADLNVDRVLKEIRNMIDG